MERLLMLTTLTAAFFALGVYGVLVAEADADRWQAVSLLCLALLAAAMHRAFVP